MRLVFMFRCFSEEGCTQGSAKSFTLVNRVVALWMPLASSMEFLSETVLSRLCLWMLFATGGFTVIAEVLMFVRPRVVVWDAIVGSGGYKPPPSHTLVFWR